METTAFTICLTGRRLFLALCIGLLQAQAQAAQSSDLSRWLDNSVQEELVEMLTAHPRYRGRSVAVVHGNGTALADDLATTLRKELAAAPAVLVVAPEPTRLAATTLSVDDLDCVPTPASELRLLLDVQEDRVRGDRVSLTLQESGSTDATALALWAWSGNFSRAERARARLPGEPRAADGSLDAPWSEADVEIAARALTRDLACDLRPAVATRLRVDWPGNDQLAAVFRDTVNTSRHLLGGYRELALTDRDPQYRVVAELRPFRDNIFQLWISGRPQVPMRDPVQAVTYFRLPALEIRNPPPGNPLDYLQVELLSARQADRGRSAELRVALRLVNSAQWPIAYGLRLSGGHFVHCIARQGNYRHDGYGLLSGTIAPGASEVRDLVVEKLQHVPLPWYGAARCAGSNDLDAFEDYALHGHRVTDYVRWDL